jgi:hypothetical protein
MTSGNRPRRVRDATESSAMPIKLNQPDRSPAFSSTFNMEGGGVDRVMGEITLDSGLYERSIKVNQGQSRCQTLALHGIAMGPPRPSEPV